MVQTMEVNHALFSIMVVLSGSAIGMIGGAILALSKMRKSIGTQTTDLPCLPARTRSQESPPLIASNEGHR